MKNKANYIFFSLGLIIFVYFVYDIGITNISTNLRRTGFWIFPIIMTWLIVYGINTYVLKLIIKAQKKDVKFGKVFSINLSGFALNYVTPFLTLGGEPYKAIEISKIVGSETSASSVIIYNMQHMFSHVFFWITGIFVAFIYGSNIILNPKILLSLLLVLLLLMIMFLTSYNKGFLFIFLKVLDKIPLPRKINTRFNSHKDKISAIDRTIISFYKNNKRKFWLTLILEYFARVLASFEFYFILNSIGIVSGVTESVYINAFSSLLLNLTFFIPMELGVREGSMYLLMPTLKIVSGVGIYVSLINRIRELLFIAVGLLLMYLPTEARFIKGIENE